MADPEPREDELRRLLHEAHGQLLERDRLVEELRNALARQVADGERAERPRRFRRLRGGVLRDG